MNMLLDSDEVTEKRYAEYLRERGYRVVKLTDIKTPHVNSISDLIDLFYARLYQDRPNTKRFYISRKKVDFKFANKFIESRMSTGISKKEAIKECAVIIDKLMDKKEELNIKSIVDFSIFGQDKMAWITDVVVKLLNQEESEKEVEEFLEMENKRNVPEDETLKNARDFLDIALKGDMNNNGKEEGRD